MAIVWTPDAIEWMAAALYATRLSNSIPDLPEYRELPERLKTKWREIGKQWIETIIPMLETRPT